MPERLKAPVVRLNPDLGKIVEAVLFLIGEAAARTRSITQYEIAKSIFLADRAHLNRYGRPITFDNYAAMKHGPVPSLTYDLLKDNPGALALIGGKAPWTRTARENSGAFDFAADRAADLDLLAPSEQELLSNSLATVTSLGFSQVRKLTHEDAAYIDAWEGDEGNENGSYAMSLAMMFDVPDPSLANDLAFISKNAM